MAEQEWERNVFMRSEGGYGRLSAKRQPKLEKLVYDGVVCLSGGFGLLIRSGLRIFILGCVWVGHPIISSGSDIGRAGKGKR